MLIDLSSQSYDHTLPPMPVKTYSGSALPLAVSGIPASCADGYVTGVKFKATNADGVAYTATASKDDCGRWCATFAATCFTNYGEILRGLAVLVTLAKSSTESSVVKWAISDLSVVQGSPDAQPGSGGGSSVQRGDDVYLKSYVDDNSVQHFVKQVMSYDAAIGWGADWIGDYILSDGEFVPANEEEE